MCQGERPGPGRRGRGGKRLAGRGADWWLLQIADRLGKTVDELSLSPEEFCWWRWQIADEKSRQWKDTDRKDWHLAQIAYQVYLLRMTVVGLFSKVTIDLTLADFLPSTARPKNLPKARAPRMTRARAAEISKAKWFAAVGYHNVQSEN